MERSPVCALFRHEFPEVEIADLVQSAAATTYGEGDFDQLAAATILRQAGCEITLTTSGAQALERVLAQPPELILLDLMMLEMVQNLLDTNRIERGEMKLNLTATDLCPVLSTVVEAQRPRAGAKQQRIQLQSESAPVTVAVDPNIMVRVLENLVSITGFGSTRAAAFPRLPP